ncbi:uncharacterized protein EI90DRAFT_3285224 [Cantharellus anzutake]|uniref:uncharacterized protein n=1 Tax=Cantharellus anzutake TaxID=1750568 RepID=UPI001906C5E1|nr:uncharacterized protein EI90DRAFT_3285224 [Cantharellus anzutake]KAF8342056.1 hypothetical protein EI90DRAFT_3285224 [Cantharellus anzutake]
MPPKGSTRRSNRAPKASKDDEFPKSRRSGSHKARADSSHLEDTRSSQRASKNGAEVSPLEDPTREEDEEDSGVTRCVCDEAETETKEMGFMVQCEQCNVWQHGICMGIEREEDCPEKYYCEECRPDLHTALLEELERRAKAASRRDAKKAKSLSSSRTSRSISPDGRRLPMHRSPKRRNTMNSRDTDVEMNRVLDMSRKEAERSGALPEVEVDTNDGRRKRKRGADAGDSVDNPESTPSDQANGNGDSSRGRGAKTGNSTPVDTTDSNQGGRNRRSSRKEKEQSLDVDGKVKHPNQYTYRVPKLVTAVTSPTKHGKSDRHDHGTRRNLPQQSRGWSPSPVPVSYNIPDHFSHLARLLPHPTPQGINVRVGPEEDNRVLERGVKVRWPPKRTTIGEMRRRVRGMMEYVARAQLEAGERERRVEMLKAALANSQPTRASPVPGLATSTVDSQSERRAIPPATDRSPVGRESPKEKSDDAILARSAGDATKGNNTKSGATNAFTKIGGDEPSTPTPPDNVTAAMALASEAEGTPTPVPTALKISTPKPNEPTAMQLLDQLTRDLIDFQERFGAGREGKVYRDRTERERRTRAAVDVDIF